MKILLACLFITLGALMSGGSSDMIGPEKTSAAEPTAQPLPAAKTAASPARPVAKDLAAAKAKLAEIIKLRYGLKKLPPQESVSVTTLEPGTSAEGVVLWEDDMQLALDTNPCEKNPKRKQHRLFTKPYTMSDGRSENCSDSFNNYLGVKVTQQQ